MRTLTKTLHLGIAAMMSALMLGVAPLAAAQPQEFEPDFYTSALTGLEVEVSGPVYEINDAELQHYPSGEGEVIHIGSEVVAANVEVSFFDDGDTPNSSIDIYINAMESVADDFELVDRGTSGDYVYAIAHVGYQGVEIIYYIQIYEDVEGTVDLLEAILSTSREFEDDLTTAQAEIMIDGIGFMENVDAAEIAAVATGDGSLDGDTESTPVEPAETITFTQSDTTVGIGPDFAFVGDLEVRQEVEAIQIQGPNTRSMVAIGQTGVDPGTAISGFTTGVTNNYAEAQLMFEEVDEDSAMRILRVPTEDGSVRYMLIVVDMTAIPGMELLHAHELPADSVAGSLTTIQQQITLNGQPLMPQIEPESIESLVRTLDTEIMPADTVTPVTTPEATEEPEEDRSGNPRDAARLPAGDEDDTTGNTSETRDTPEATEEVTSTVSEGPGILTDSSWEGGVFGHLIEWDSDTWFVDTEYPEDLVSDEENQEDTIVLQSGTVNGTTWFFISVYGATEATPEDYLDYWTSDEFFEDIDTSGSTAEVLSSRTRGDGSGVVIAYTNGEGDEFIMIRQAIVLEDGSIVIITLDAPAADAVEMYEQAVGVTIDGDPALRVFSVSQIERAIDD